MTVVADSARAAIALIQGRLPQNEQQGQVGYSPKVRKTGHFIPAWHSLPLIGPHIEMALCDGSLLYCSTVSSIRAR
jgi:hypothetical protein